ncbi:tetratricopeptide repeat protein [Orbus sturtevantii]|uniref:tetratricopeptide repeat protein n=1 Tax=Orbus sturtevantii TaxID=3074109 RepID=UPI00370D73A5
MFKSLLYIIICWSSLIGLTACQFTAEQQQEFNPELAALARLKLGLGYLAQAKDTTDKSNEDIKLAHYNLTLANKYSPNNPNVMLGMALFDQHVGERQEADVIYQTIIKLAPTNGLYRIHYGSFLCGTGRYQEAQTQYKIATTLNRPQWKMDGLEQLGYCAIQNGDIAQANQAFKSLFQYNPNKRQDVIGMAEVYRQQGDTQIARYLLTVCK